ncbi:MAG: hypothetical protein U1F53_00470 [Burkholderiaceae bacterium]
MRRWLVICLLMWLPLQWAGAATWAYGGLGARLAHQHVLTPHAAHAPGPSDEASLADRAAALDHTALAANADDADASTGEPDDGCPLCQDTDWQATASSALPVLSGGAVAPRVEHALAIRSYVPPVPKPPARAAA